MNIPELPAPDSQGRIILYPPKPYPVRMVAVPLLGVFLFGMLAWITQMKQDEFGFVLFGCLGALFLIFAGFSLFAPYRVVLDDEGVYGGSKVLGGRIAWEQIERIKLNPTSPGSVFASRAKSSGKGSYQKGAAVTTLAPLSLEQTAALLLRLARQHNAPVMQIVTQAEVDKSGRPKPLVIFLILVVLAAKIWVMYLRAH